MCLAIPGKVVATFDKSGMFMARVQFGGITREACLEYVPETIIGDYVLVHVGFAISRIDEAEAQRTYAVLRELDQLTELESPIVEDVEESPRNSDERSAAGRKSQSNISMNIAIVPSQPES